ncbi:inorganic diphosphatase [Haloplasma contractile]|uniref:inorganic diphosphatase n=1 Tax=Haloplasma contractile SSD-17B TaxID=1033810 RepID=F7PVS3_9MOLU|nr:inorganic diphosphatase [Haloplasma contractile]ERJ12755.1 Inorganic pyrophosphatase protein [Haloplasma contractile SSD-17B]
MEQYLNFMGKQVTVVMDRPLGSTHPRYNELYYPINYGYIPNTLAEDHREIDAYIVGEFVPLSVYQGIVIAVIVRKNDVENKLVVAKKGNIYSKEQIEALVEFSERFYDHYVIMG